MIKFAKLTPYARIPSMSRDGDAGFDLYADHSGTVNDHQITQVRTGIAVEIPHGWVGLVCPRSGLAFAHGINVINAPGIIDCNFRGEIVVGLTKQFLGTSSFALNDRIAQLVVVPYYTLGSTEVDYGDLSTTNRGSNGFGSSGT